jgi:tRNA pseudouridine13 synthase
MSFDPLAPPPLLTADLPGTGGRIKQYPEDFEVEEIPAYEPSGQGDFLFLWMEKRGMGAEYFVRQVAKKLGISPGEIGAAGLKDRHAVTRQMVSVPVRCADRLDQLDDDSMDVLRVSRHSNKLRPGHLRGNRFRVLVRDVCAATASRIGPVVERIRNWGLPNYYGVQRFGREGETVQMGLAMLQGAQASGSEKSGPNISPRVPRSRFLRKLALSAAQAALFNHYLARRQSDGMLQRVLAGDVMSKRPAGGLFVVTDPEREQARFDAGETVSTGPIFGRKTFPAAGPAAEREEAVLADAGLSRASFAGFGKLLQGTRRHNLVFVEDLAAALELAGLRLTFTLPAGSYATVLLQEITKTELGVDDS